MSALLWNVDPLIVWVCVSALVWTVMTLLFIGVLLIDERLQRRSR